MVVPREPLPFPAELLGAASSACANSSTRHRRSRARQLLAVEGWVREVALALNWLHGRPGGYGFSTFSLAQVQSLQFFREQIDTFGVPTCTPAAALRELRGSTPGYDLEPAKSVCYSEGLVALPSDDRK